MLNLKILKSIKNMFRPVIFFTLGCLLAFSQQQIATENPCITLSCFSGHETTFACEFAIFNPCRKVYSVTNANWSAEVIQYREVEECQKSCCLKSVQNYRPDYNISLYFQTNETVVSNFTQIQIIPNHFCPEAKDETIRDNTNLCLNTTRYTEVPCITLRCNLTDVSTFECEFALFDTNYASYSFTEGSWDGVATIVHGTVAECKGMCCLKYIQSEVSAIRNVSVFFQTNDSCQITTSTLKLKPNNFCSQEEIDNTNNTPNACLNTTRYTETSKETLPSSSSMAALVTTATITTLPVLSVESVMGINNEQQLIDFAKMRIPKIGLQEILTKAYFEQFPPNASHHSLTSIERLELVDDGLNPNQVGTVYAEYLSPSNFTQIVNEVQDGSTRNSILPLGNSPVFSLTAFELQSNRTLQARLNFSIDLSNATGRQQTVENYLKNSTRGYSITRLSSATNRCGFYDVGRQVFSVYGCQLSGTNGNRISCYCNHTTLFAVLLSVQSYEVPAGVKILSYVLESITVFFLLVTMGTLLSVRKKVRSDRTVVQINLTIALAFFHLLNISQDLALYNNPACEFLAVSIHFFLLSTGTWMTIEGLTMFVKTTDKVLSINKKNPKKVAVVKLACGWGIPALIVVVSCAAGFPTGRYMRTSNLHDFYLRCWVSNEYGMLAGAVIAPLAFLYLINIFITIRMIWFVNHLRSKTLSPPTVHNNGGASAKIREHTENVTASLKVFLMLFPALGFPLIFSFLTSVEPYEAAVGFMYVNVILNGLQGFFIFLVYCVFGSEVREASIRKFKRLQLLYSSEDSQSQSPNKLVQQTHSTNLPLKTNTSSSNL